jgi:hypothetical protein
MDRRDAESRHVDDYVDDHTTPRALRWFLFVNRLPATLRLLCESMGIVPELYADIRNSDPSNELRHCRVVMASRMGDVGINYDFNPDRYEHRVMVDRLSNFFSAKVSSSVNRPTVPMRRSMENSSHPELRYHELKCWPKPYSELVSGHKGYEIRRHDRNYQVGHMMLIREWDPDREQYTGQYSTWIVQHLTPGGEWGLPQDLCILGVQKSEIELDPTCPGCGRVQPISCGCVAYKGPTEV